MIFDSLSIFCGKQKGQGLKVSFLVWNLLGEGHTFFLYLRNNLILTWLGWGGGPAVGRAGEDAGAAGRGRRNSRETVTWPGHPAGGGAESAGSHHGPHCWEGHAASRDGWRRGTGVSGVGVGGIASRPSPLRGTLQPRWMTQRYRCLDGGGGGGQDHITTERDTATQMDDTEVQVFGWGGGGGQDHITTERDTATQMDDTEVKVFGWGGGGRITSPLRGTLQPRWMTQRYRCLDGGGGGAGSHHHWEEHPAGRDGWHRGKRGGGGGGGG